jgi:hypothetical protein
MDLGVERHMQQNIVLGSVALIATEARPASVDVVVGSKHSSLLYSMN